MFCEQTEDILEADIGEGVVCQGLLERVLVEVLLDTGSARTLLRSNLVLEGKVLEGKRIGVRQIWEEPTEGELPYVLRMRDRLTEVTKLVQENLAQAYQAQKQCHFKLRDYVLVLLLTSIQKLRAQWQGPFIVKEKKGEVN